MCSVASVFSVELVYCVWTSVSSKCDGQQVITLQVVFHWKQIGDLKSHLPVLCQVQFSSSFYSYTQKDDNRGRTSSQSDQTCIKLMSCPIIFQPISCFSRGK